MSLILSIETSTNVCSVCLGLNNTIVSELNLYEANSHASNLSVLVSQLFNECEYTLNDLDAVAVSSGPGSYTGLRIGVSFVKGICYSLNIPLISVNSLYALAYNAFDKNMYSNPDALICPMIDARRMEVYTCLFTNKMEQHSSITAEIIDENSFINELDKGQILFLGNGAAKCKDVIKHSNAIFIENEDPLARNINNFAQSKFDASDFEDVAYFEPFYLKDFVATTPKKKVI